MNFNFAFLALLKEAIDWLGNVYAEVLFPLGKFHFQLEQKHVYFGSLVLHSR